MRKPIEHREQIEDQLTDRIAALEQAVRRLERAHRSNEASADCRAEALLTMLSILARMLHAGPFDLHLYRGKIAAVAELFEGAGGDRHAADLCRLLLASIDPREPRIRPQLRLVSRTDDPIGAALQTPLMPGTASTAERPPGAATDTPQ